MKKSIRTFALAFALAATPACAQLALPNPLSAAQRADQSAYAVLQTYAALVEEAADIVRDPATPASIRRTIGAAEREATPVVEALSDALLAYNTARNGADAEAARLRLERARIAAEPAVAALAALVQTSQP